jgi:hypothetical protein
MAPPGPRGQPGGAAFYWWARRRSRRGSHTAVRSLEKAMLDYLDERNKDPKPFVRTADADLILGKVRRLSEHISDSGRVP